VHNCIDTDKICINTGVCAGDELLLQGLPLSNLSSLADLIRADFPRNDHSFTIYENDAYAPVKGGIDGSNRPIGWENATHPDDWRVPASLDWISMDLYRLNATYIETFQEVYEQHLYPRMTVHQHALVVPAAFSAMGAGSLNGVNWTLAQYDDAMEQIAWAAYNWTINDSHLVGLAPWHWYDDGRIGSYSYGVASLPRTQAAYTLISRLLKQAIKTDDSPLTWAGSDGRRKYSNAQDDLATPAAPRFDPPVLVGSSSTPWKSLRRKFHGMADYFAFGSNQIFGFQDDVQFNGSSWNPGVGYPWPGTPRWILPGAAMTRLPNAKHLRNFGYLQPVDATGNKSGTRTFRSKNTTTFAISPHGNELQHATDSSWGPVFSGLPAGSTATCVTTCYCYQHRDPAEPLVIMDSITLADGRLVASTPVCPPREAGQSMSDRIAVFRSSDGGRHFLFRAIAPVMAFLEHGLHVGPAEHAIVQMASGKILMVTRPDGDGACDHPPTGPYYNYHQSVSSTFGDTWSAPVPIVGAGCVWPRLHRLDSGPTQALLMTGGRWCSGNTVDNFLWVQSGVADADAAAWVRYSLSYQHNKLWKGDPALRFSSAVNQSHPFAFETQSYTSVVPVGPTTVVVLYNKYTDGLGVHRNESGTARRGAILSFYTVICGHS
jgi:hypothetical protein